MGKDDKSIVPKQTGAKNALYDVPDKTESAKKISAILEQSNALLFESFERPKTNIHDMPELINSTEEYFAFCQNKQCKHFYHLSLYATKTKKR